TVIVPLSITNKSEAAPTNSNSLALTNSTQNASVSNSDTQADLKNSLIDPAALPQDLKTNVPATTNVTVTAEQSLTGLLFSPDGKTLYVSNAGGTVWAFNLEGKRIVGAPR